MNFHRFFAYIQNKKKQQKVHFQTNNPFANSCSSSYFYALKKKKKNVPLHLHRPLPVLNAAMFFAALLAASSASSAAAVASRAWRPSEEGFVFPELQEVPGWGFFLRLFRLVLGSFTGFSKENYRIFREFSKGLGLFLFF